MYFLMKEDYLWLELSVLLKGMMPVGPLRVGVGFN